MLAASIDSISSLPPWLWMAKAEVLVLLTVFGLIQAVYVGVAAAVSVAAVSRPTYLNFSTGIFFTVMSSATVPRAPVIFIRMPSTL